MVSEQQNILRKLELLYNCIRKGHNSIKCNFHKDKYHASLCLKKLKLVESFATRVITMASVINEEKVKDEVVEKEGSEGTVGATNFIHSKNHVFLQKPKHCVIHLTPVSQTSQVDI